MPTRQKRFLTAAVLVVAIGGTILVGSIRHAAGDADGGPLVPASTRPTSAPSRLRLATFNIHSGVGLDDRLDLQRTANLLKGFDLICLNEVQGAGPWWNGQTNELAELLQRDGIFAPTERRYFRESFGTAFLYDCNIVHWHRYQLPSGSNMAFRNRVILEIPFGPGTLRVLMSHVGRESDHQPQLKIVTQEFLKLPEPAVLMGDMNTTADDPTMRALLDTPGVIDPIGKKTGKTISQRIDYILLRGLNWMNAGMVENNASDHPMAWVEIEAR